MEKFVKRRKYLYHSYACSHRVVRYADVAKYY